MGPERLLRERAKHDDGNCALKLKQIVIFIIFGVPCSFEIHSTLVTFLARRG